MGDIADMMLDGAMCEQCGEDMGLSEGYPRLCEACQAEEDQKEMDRENAEAVNNSQSL
jgi:predicted amidophosphoribosyltransferase